MSLSNAPHRRALAWRGTPVVVEAPNDAPLAWLAEFLGPWFTDVALPASGAPTVVLRAGEGAYSRWRAKASLLDAEVACFTMDGADDVWRRARGADGAEAFVDEGRAVALVAAPQARRWEVLEDEDLLQGRSALMRLVRELSGAEALARHDVPLHAAAIARGGRATAFVGPRRAGKSTLLLHALHGGDVAMISNDRVFARFEGDTPIARGMPTIVSLREGSLARHPELASEAHLKCWRYHIPLAEAQRHRRAGTRPLPPNTRPVAGMSSRQLAHVLDISLIAEAPLATIVLPRIDPTVSAPCGFVLEVLDPADAARRIATEGLTAGGRRADVLDVGVALPQPEAQRIAIERLARAVTCVSLRMGPSAYDGGTLLAALDLETPSA